MAGGGLGYAGRMAGSATTRSEAARKRFADKKWDGLVPMIEDYAREARAVAAADFRAQLGDDGDSLENLERILNRLSPAPAPLPATEGEWLSLLWGCWFGEWLRHRHGGAWTMTIYPGSQFAVPTLEFANGSRVYPTMKTHRRLSFGADESLPAFYLMLAARLATPSNPTTSG